MTTPPKNLPPRPLIGQRFTDALGQTWVCVDNQGADRWVCIIPGPGSQLPPSRVRDDTFQCGHCHERVSDTLMTVHIPMCKKGHSAEEIERVNGILQEATDSLLVEGLLGLRKRLHGVESGETARFVIEVETLPGVDLLEQFPVIEAALKKVGLHNARIWLEGEE